MARKTIKELTVENAELKADCVREAKYSHDQVGVITELTARVDGMRASNNEKIAALNKMSVNLVKAEDEIESLGRSNDAYNESLRSANQKVDIAQSALDTIQATCVSVSAPDGQAVLKEVAYDSADENLLHIIAHLRFILKPDY